MENLVKKEGLMTPIPLFVVQSALQVTRFLTYGRIFIMDMIFPFRYECFDHTLIGQENDEILKYRLALA